MVVLLLRPAQQRGWVYVCVRTVQYLRRDVICDKLPTHNTGNRIRWMEGGRVDDRAATEAKIGSVRPKQNKALASHCRTQPDAESRTVQANQEKGSKTKTPRPMLAR